MRTFSPCFIKLFISPTFVPIIGNEYDIDSKTVFGIPSNNEVIKLMDLYIKANLNTFQNALVFKQSINKYLNKLLMELSNDHYHNDVLVTNIKDNEQISISDLFSTSFVNIDNLSNKSLIHIDTTFINQSVKYNYLLSMSPSQIINSNLFLAYLVKLALQ